MSDAPDLDFAQFMQSFRELEQPMRAWAMVGSYMGYFSMMENFLSDSVVQLLGLDTLRGAIVARNLGYIEKVRTFRTVANLAVTGKERDRLDDLGKRLEALAQERNSVAHSPFGESSTSDGVEFYVTDAKRNLKTAFLDWSVEETCRRVDVLRLLGDELRSIENTVEYTLAAAKLRKINDQLEKEKLSRMGNTLTSLLEEADRRR